MIVKRPLANKAEEFALFFVEQYAAAKNQSGKDVYNLFEKTGAYQFIKNNFEALHTVSTPNAIEDVDNFITNQHEKGVTDEI